MKDPETQEEVQFRALDLGDGVTMFITEPIVKTGSYGQCGNFSAMLKEDFTLTISTKGKKQVIAASTINSVHADVEHSVDKWSIVAGFDASGGKKDHPPKGKDHNQGPDHDKGKNAATGPNREHDTRQGTGAASPSERK